MLRRIRMIGRFAAICLCLSVSLLANADVRKVERRFDMKPGGELYINSSKGSIRVDTWTKNEVYVQVKLSGPSEKVLERFDLSIEKEANRAIIIGDSGRHSRVNVKYEVKIPKKFNVDLNTGGGSVKLGEEIIGKVRIDTSGGAIRVGNVKGDLKAETSGGSISIGDVTGVVDTDTAGGSIKIGNGASKISADTAGGKIRIGASNGDVIADTSGGGISIGHTKGNVRADTSGGSIRVDGSDGNVKVETSGGSIQVHNTAGAVEAETAGGGIKITQSRGRVQAVAEGGSVYVELIETNPEVDTSMDIETEGGQITLFLPANLAATIHAELEEGFHRGGANIYSDFPLKITNNGESTLATGDINGGGDKINLKAEHGDITIKVLD